MRIKGSQNIVASAANSAVGGNYEELPFEFSNCKTETAEELYGKEVREWSTERVVFGNGKSNRIRVKVLSGLLYCPGETYGGNNRIHRIEFVGRRGFPALLIRCRWGPINSEKHQGLQAKDAM